MGVEVGLLWTAMSVPPLRPGLCNEGVHCRVATGGRGPRWGGEEGVSTSILGDRARKRCS